MKTLLGPRRPAYSGSTPLVDPVRDPQPSFELRKFLHLCEMLKEEATRDSEACQTLEEFEQLRIKYFGRLR